MGIRRLPEVESAPLPRGVRAVHEVDADGVLCISVSDNLTADEAHDEVLRIQRLVARERLRGLVAVPAVLGAEAARTVRAHPGTVLGTAAGSAVAVAAVVGTMLTPSAFHSHDHVNHPRPEVRPPAVTAPPSPGGDQAPAEVTPVSTVHHRRKGTPTGSPTAVPVGRRPAAPTGSAGIPIVGRTPKVRRVPGVPRRVPLPTDVPKSPPVVVAPVRPTPRVVFLRVGLGVGPVGLGAEVSSRPGDAGLLPTVAARVRVRPR